MSLLKDIDWPGFKVTPEGTLAYKKFVNDVVYLRAINEDIDPVGDARSSLGLSWNKRGIKPPQVGILYRWGDSDEYIAVFAGINPMECNEEINGAAMTAFKNYLADDPDRYFDLAPAFNIKENDQLYRLAVPFNRNNGGFMPIIWNLGSTESRLVIHSVKDIERVSQLEEKYPPVDLETDREDRYMALSLEYNDDSILFGYNRNHLAYNGKAEDLIASWPIGVSIPIGYKVGSSPLEQLFEEEPEVRELVQGKAKFNGKANGLLDAAGLSGKA